MAEGAPFLFDLRLRGEGLSDLDLETLWLFGVRGVLLERTPSPRGGVKGLLEGFEALLARQVPRFRGLGFQAWACLGVSEAEVPRRGMDEVLDGLSRHLGRGSAAAVVGPLSWHGERPGGLAALLAQLELAEAVQLPALAVAPPQEAAQKHLLSALRRGALPPSRVLVTGPVGRTVRAVLALGMWAGLSLHPDDVALERACALVKGLGPTRLLLLSGTGRGASDLLALPRAHRRLQRLGLTHGVVSRVTSRNALGWLQDVAP